jgi:hypothetical protein
MNLREIGWDGMDWIDLAQDRLGSCEHGNEPSDFIKCLEVLECLHNWQFKEALSSTKE